MVRLVGVVEYGFRFRGKPPEGRVILLGIYAVKSSEDSGAKSSVASSLFVMQSTVDVSESYPHKVGFGQWSVNVIICG